MNKNVLAMMLVSAIAVPPVVVADHEPVYECDWSRTYEVTDGTAEGTYYYHDGLIWAESNGIWVEKPAGRYTGKIVSHDLQPGANPYLPDYQPCIEDPLAMPDSIFI